MFAAYHQTCQPTISSSTVSTSRPAPDWKRPPGRPRKTWIQQVEEDHGCTIDSLWSSAHDRSLWRSLRPSLVKRRSEWSEYVCMYVCMYVCVGVGRHRFPERQWSKSSFITPEGSKISHINIRPVPRYSCLRLFPCTTCT